MNDEDIREIVELIINLKIDRVKILFEIILELRAASADSIYRETPRKVKYWRSLGADFINMEISPFYVVSKVLS